MKKVLFEITEENLDTGLRGIPVGTCVTSTVDPEKGLFYCGIPIAELVEASCESVIYLLLNGKLPNEKQLASFVDQLHKRSALAPQSISYIQALPKKGHSMDIFLASLMIVKTFEGKQDYVEDCINLIAKLPTLVALVINHLEGVKHPVTPNAGLSYMQNFSAMLGIPKKDPQLLSEVFRLFNILHYDHGGGNLSTFVGKAVASGLQDLYGSIAAGMSALAGPRHGLANQLALQFVEEMIQALGSSMQEKSVEEYLKKKIAKKELIYGFGHAVLRTEDARATVQYAFAQKHFPNHPLTQAVLYLRKVGPGVLKSLLNIASPYPNVDAVSGSLLTMANFVYPQHYTLLFGLSRGVGIAAQILYERTIAREGKGTPIVRPKYLYRPRL